MPVLTNWDGACHFHPPSFQLQNVPIIDSPLYNQFYAYHLLHHVRWWQWAHCWMTSVSHDSRPWRCCRCWLGLDLRVGLYLTILLPGGMLWIRIWNWSLQHLYLQSPYHLVHTGGLAMLKKVCWCLLVARSMGDDMVVVGSFNVLVNCVLFWIIDRQKTASIPPVRYFWSRMWGPLEKQLTYNILISDFVGGPPSGGVVLYWHSEWYRPAVVVLILLKVCLSDHPLCSAWSLCIAIISITTQLPSLGPWAPSNRLFIQSNLKPRSILPQTLPPQA